MKNLKLFILGIIVFLFSACGGDFPPPSFSRSINLQSVDYIEIPDMPGGLTARMHFPMCPNRHFSVAPCEDACGVNTVTYQDSSIQIQDTFRIKIVDLTDVLDRAAREGCFEYNQPTNVTYTRYYQTPFESKNLVVTITETFAR